MNRILLKSRADFEKLISDCRDEIGGDFGFDSIEELEQFFGISFVSEHTDDTKRKYVVNWGFDTCEPGYTMVEPWGESDDLDLDAIDQGEYTKEFTFVDERAPISYPVLLLMSIENGFDRMGDITTRMGFFVYPSDFELKGYVEKGTTYVDDIMNGE